jgi:uncharacterized protein (DUF2236 family)
MTLQADTYPLGRRDAPSADALCGPSSASWRLRQDGGIVMSMAKARAALLQIAHPKIAAGLADHSSFDSDPYRRVQITGQTMSAILFGSNAERTEALRLLRKLHATVRGTSVDGDTYSASDPELLWFVLATLVDSDLLVEQRYAPVFDERDRDAYYEEFLELSDAFRVPRSIVAPTRRALRDQLEAAAIDLRVTPDGRRLASRILEPTFIRAPRPVIWGYAHLLVDLLPPHVRAGYGYAEKRPPVARAVVSVARIALPKLPTRLRRRRIEPRA